MRPQTTSLIFATLLGLEASCSAGSLPGAVGKTETQTMQELESIYLAHQRAQNQTPCAQPIRQETLTIGGFHFFACRGEGGEFTDRAAVSVMGVVSLVAPNTSTAAYELLVAGTPFDVAERVVWLLDGGRTTALRDAEQLSQITGMAAFEAFAAPSVETTPTGERRLRAWVAAPPSFEPYAIVLTATPQGALRVERLSMKALDPSDPVDVLLRSLRDGDTLVRVAAAREAGTKKVGAAVPDLILCLDDPYERLRLTSATALGAIGDPSARPHLERLAAEDPSPKVRLAAENALEALR